MDLLNNSRYLHDSMLINILVKLPLKSVITCKLVCKSWYRLISDSSFTGAYVSIHHFKCNLYFGYKSVYLNETGRVDLETSLNLKLQLPMSENDILRMVGSCNGMCCFLIETPFPVDEFAVVVYIYNPLTCEYIEIRERRESANVGILMSIGFGCSKYTNRCKVVRFLPEAEFRIFNGSIIQPLQGHVLTVGVDSEWREFEDPCIPWSTDIYSSLFNGVLHWLGFETSSPESRIIYAFDVEEERGQRIQLPLALQRLENYLFIGILNDHLCAIGCEDYFCVWIMKDYGVVESWTKYILLRDQIPQNSLLWFPSFVCYVSSNLFDVNQKEAEDMDSPTFARDGEKEHIISSQDVPYVPCFSSLNDAIKGGSLRVRKIQVKDCLSLCLVVQQVRRPSPELRRL